jgi:hypothetical protein
MLSVKAGRSNTYLGANEQERALARTLCYAVRLKLIPVLLG